MSTSCSCRLQEHLKATSQRQGGDAGHLGGTWDVLWQCLACSVQVQAAFRELSAVAWLMLGAEVCQCVLHLLAQVLAHVSGSLADRVSFARSDRLGRGLGVVGRAGVSPHHMISILEIIFPYCRPQQTPR